MAFLVYADKEGEREAYLARERQWASLDRSQHYYGLNPASCHPADGPDVLGPFEYGRGPAWIPREHTAEVEQAYTNTLDDSTNITAAAIPHEASARERHATLCLVAEISELDCDYRAAEIDGDEALDKMATIFDLMRQHGPIEALEMYRDSDNEPEPPSENNTVCEDELARSPTIATPEASVQADALAEKIEGCLVDAGQYVEEEPPVLDPVIDGLFERGDKVAVIGPSKTKKTFFLLNAMLRLVAGQDFLGLHVPKARHVFFVNMEIKPAHMHRRVRWMARGMGLDACALKGRLLIFNARGLGISRQQLLDIVYGAVKGVADVVVFDPAYKLIEGDENKTEGWKPLLSAFDVLTKETGAAVMFSHHDAKGQAGDRDIRDRGAGSNIVSRDYDCGITLTRHRSEPEATVVEFIPRNFREPEPVVARFEEGHFVVASDLAPQAATSRTQAAKTRRLSQDEAVGVLGDTADTTAGVKQRLRDSGATRDLAADLVGKLVLAGPWERWTPPGKNQPTFIGTPSAIKRKRQEWSDQKQRNLPEV